MEKIPRSRASELKKRKQKTKREKIVLACSDRQAEPPLLVFSEGETGSTASPSSPALGLLLPAARTEEVELREVHDGHRRAGEGGGEPESRATSSASSTRATAPSTMGPPDPLETRAAAKESAPPPAPNPQLCRGEGRSEDMLAPVGGRTGEVR
jgi:hypothetical protein